MQAATVQSAKRKLQAGDVCKIGGHRRAYALAVVYTLPTRTHYGRSTTLSSDYAQFSSKHFRLFLAPTYHVAHHPTHFHPPVGIDSISLKSLPRPFYRRQTSRWHAAQLCVQLVHVTSHHIIDYSAWIFTMVEVRLLSLGTLSLHLPDVVAFNTARCQMMIELSGRARHCHRQQPTSFRCGRSCCVTLKTRMKDTIT